MQEVRATGPTAARPRSPSTPRKEELGFVVLDHIHLDHIHLDHIHLDHIHLVSVTGIVTPGTTGSMMTVSRGDANTCAEGEIGG
jgi:hypothetical protein